MLQDNFEYLPNDVYQGVTETTTLAPATNTSHAPYVDESGITWSWLPEVQVYAPITQEGKIPNYYDVIVPESYKFDYQQIPKGGTKETENKYEDLFQINSNYIDKIGEQVKNFDLQFIQTAFGAVNKTPIIDNKSVELSKLSTLMEDPKLYKSLMEQAMEIEKNPDLDTEIRSKLIDNHVYSMLFSGAMLGAKHRFINQLQKSAEQLAGLSNMSSLGFVGDNSPYKLLFNENNNLRTKDKYFEAVVNYRNEFLKKWKEENPPPTRPEDLGYYDPNNPASMSERGRNLQRQIARGSGDMTYLDARKYTDPMTGQPSANWVDPYKTNYQIWADKVSGITNAIDGYFGNYEGFLENLRKQELGLNGN